MSQQTAETSEDAQAQAAACAEVMLQEDRVARSLGIGLDHIAPGAATVSMELTDVMANGHGTGHGGYIFLLADMAFQLACNTYNQRTVAQHCSITYLAPASPGDRLTATAREQARSGRSGIYDIRVADQAGRHIAEFRGHSRVVNGHHLPEPG